MKMLHNARQLKQKEYYNKGVKDCQYSHGNLVFLYDIHLKTGEAANFHLYWKGDTRLSVE